MFKGLNRRLLAITLSLVPSINACLACAPDPPVDVLFNCAHPDFPLKKFADGNLGIIQPGWAKTYLAISYLYLAGRHIDASEQKSIEQIWQNKLLNYSQWTDSRLDKAITDYGIMRGKVVPKVGKSDPSPYVPGASFQFNQLFQANAFELATKTLGQMIAALGANDAAVKEWVKTQDIIFSLSQDSPDAKLHRDLPALISQNVLAKYNRGYQVAALLFYEKEYDKAKSAFEAIAKDASSPWHGISQYMVARCLLAQALSTKDKAQITQLDDALDTQIKLVPSEYASDAEGLQRAAFYLSKSRDEVFHFLSEAILKPNSSNFGRDIDDLCFLFDQQSDDAAPDTPKPKAIVTTGGSDLLDFVNSIQQRDGNNIYGIVDDKQMETQNVQNAKHAIERFHATHSLPWLVAALSTNDMNKPEMIEVVKEANGVKETSPAYLTVSFYLVDDLIKKHQVDAARDRLKNLLARADLNPTSRNLFKSQSMAVSQSSDEYVKNAIQQSVVRTDANDSAQLYKDYPKWETRDGYFLTDTTIDGDVAVDWNLNLPLSWWLKLAQDSTIPAELRKCLVRSAFARAIVVNDRTALLQLSPQLAQYFPFLRSSLAQYKAANDDASQKFALACLTLRTSGMTPYIAGGVERSGNGVNDFSYYQENYWLPKSGKPGAGLDDFMIQSSTGLTFLGNNRINAMKKSYRAGGISRFLTREEKLAAASEQKSLVDNPPAKLFGDTIFAYAKSKPTDPFVPEMLYRIVKLPKWSGASPISSSYSKKAYFEIHKSYPKNSWTQKAVCYY